MRGSGTLAYAMSEETSITVIQEGVDSLASALLNAQQYEIFIDAHRVGVLNGYQNRKTCVVPAGLHSVYVRAYARASVTITRVYGYSRKLEVNVSPGENKQLFCGVVKGPPIRRYLIFGGLLITVLLAAGLGSIGHITQRIRYAVVMAAALLTLASSWYGYSSAPGSSIYLRET